MLKQTSLLQTYYLLKFHFSFFFMQFALNDKILSISIRVWGKIYIDTCSKLGPLKILRTKAFVLLRLWLSPALDIDYAISFFLN